MAKHRPLLERFMEKVEPVPESGCWLWTASIAKNGYGAIGTDAYTVELAHRVSWKLHCGDIPTGMWVLHKCDIRCCVNPSHLYLGTVKDNAKDLKERGKPYIPRFPHDVPEMEAMRVSRLPRGADHHRPTSKLDEDTVLLIFNADGSQHEIAKRFGVCQQTVSNIKLKKRWGYLHANT